MNIVPTSLFASYRFLWLALILLMVPLAGCPGCADPMENEEEFFFPRDMFPYEFDGEPTLQAPDRMLFLEMEVGERRTRFGEIRNEGRATLELLDFIVEGPFELEFPEFADSPPSRLSPRESVTFQVTYEAFDEDPRQGSLTIFSNDPKNETHEVALLANVDLPCLLVEPTSLLRFGSQVRGASSQRNIRLINCSETQPVDVEFADFITDEAFSFVELQDQNGEPRVLPPGTSQVVPIGFAPQAVRSFEGALTVRSADPINPEVQLVLRGDGASPDCPEAVISASSMQANAVAAPQATLQGEPLEVVTFNASMSQAYGGNTIADYEWSLVMRPSDTIVELEQSQGVSNSLYLELAGSYEVELHVWDSEGIRSCEPARMAVESVSGDGLHIQLVWDTPNDPSRTNNIGADLDLHLRHQNGVWNTDPLNCYWLNMNPNWGDPNNNDMNPSLDIDKIDGWGPENINLKIPEDGRYYSIGVYYFSDHGFGASYGTTRIFIDGILELEIQNRRITSQQFWHVADVAWPSREITIYDSITQGFPASN